MSFTLPLLPYSLNALEPHMSQETLLFHYGKHHKKYIENLNNSLLTEKRFLSIEDIIKAGMGALYNNASQVYNHTFFWNSMSPDGGDLPTGLIKKLIINSFGTFDKFKDKFTKMAMAHFGSGWIWVIKESDLLISLETTTNAYCPLTEGKRLLLTCDLWEHAYYIDHRNDRMRYLSNWWKLINWDFANKNLI